eukprot:TRINITY_DN7164_c0_g1_i3.p1 TRINITY_DN7164_c0_g1~~TRINITY_DN7164_c0_g1_i3.p1  ORF type:complete len:188 (-),score=30.47 TRINITY_DN7164_c0_g1_i3:15-578(-)
MGSFLTEDGFYDLNSIILAFYLNAHNTTREKASHFYRFFDQECREQLSKEKICQIFEKLTNIVFNYSKQFCEVDTGLFDRYKDWVAYERENLIKKLNDSMFSESVTHVKESTFVEKLVAFDNDLGFPILSGKGIRSRIMKFLYREARSKSSMEETPSFILLSAREAKEAETAGLSSNIFISGLGEDH